MKFSDLLTEYIDAMIDGEPKGSQWLSIDDNARDQREYRERMQWLRDRMDEMISKGQP